jgi:hypothetical protein
MTLRRLGMLQWFALGAGLAALTAQHLLGFAVTEAECSRAGAAHGISNDTWQLGLMVTAALVVIAAGAAAVAVLRGTRGSSYEDEPAVGRIRFFAIAALVTNTLFLAIVLLDGIAATASLGCSAQ